MGADVSSDEARYATLIHSALEGWAAPSDDLTERRARIEEALLREIEIEDTQVTRVDDEILGKGFVLACQIGGPDPDSRAEEWVAFLYAPGKNHTDLWWFEHSPGARGWVRRGHVLLRTTEGDAIGLEEIRRSAGVMTTSDWEARRLAVDGLASAIFSDDLAQLRMMESISSKWCYGGDRWLHLLIDERYVVHLDEAWEVHRGVSYGINITPRHQGFLGVTLCEGDTVFGIHDFAIHRERATLHLVDNWIEAYPSRDLTSLADIEREARRILDSMGDAEYERSFTDDCSGPLRRSGPIDLGALAYKHDDEL